MQNIIICQGLRISGRGIKQYTNGVHKSLQYKLWVTQEIGSYLKITKRVKGNFFDKNDCTFNY